MRRSSRRRCDAVVERSRERTDNVLDAINDAIRKTLEDWRKHGNLDDQFEPRGWHEREADK